MSPTSVRYCIGVRMMSACTWAATAAACTRCMSRSGSKQAMLSAIVPDSSRSSWATTPTALRQARQARVSRSGRRARSRLGRLVEAEQQLQQRRLAAAGAARDGDVIARRDFEVDVLEHQRVGRAVAERHVLHARCALRPRAGRRRARRLRPASSRCRPAGRGAGRRKRNWMAWLIRPMARSVKSGGTTGRRTACRPRSPGRQG